MGAQEHGIKREKSLQDAVRLAGAWRCQRFSSPIFQRIFVTFSQDEPDLRLLLVPPSTGSGELDITARQSKL